MRGKRVTRRRGEAAIAGVVQPVVMDGTDRKEQEQDQQQQQQQTTTKKRSETQATIRNAIVIAGIILRQCDSCDSLIMRVTAGLMEEKTESHEQKERADGDG